MTVSRLALLTQTLTGVSSGAPATIAFNPTPAAQLAVVTVGYQAQSSIGPLNAWNYVDSDGGPWVLQNNNLDVLAPNPWQTPISAGGMRAKQGTRHGKFYFEVQAKVNTLIVGLATANAVFQVGVAGAPSGTSGIIQKDTNTTAYWCTAYDAIVYVASGLASGSGAPCILKNGANVGGLDHTVIIDDWLAIAFDADAGRLWLKNLTNGSTWNNNPAADPSSGVGGISTAGLSSTILYPVIASDAALAGGATRLITTNWAGPFAGTMPAGFSTWANTLYEVPPPPSVTCDGETLTLNNTQSIDPTVGAIALYSLPLTAPPDAPRNFVIQPAGYQGNTQVSIASYSGTNQKLGPVVVNEYGDHDDGVNTGTTTMTPIAGSLVMLAGDTFFGGTPSGIVVTGADWTLVDQKTAANQGIFLAESAGGGACTFTDPTNYWTMMVLGYEVLAGTPLAQDGVVTVNSHAAVLGIINAASPQTVSFDPGQTADLLVVTLAWASSDPFFPPAVTFDGVIMHYVAAQALVSGPNGAVGLWVLALDDAVIGARDIVVNSNPNYAGYTSLVVQSFGNSAQLLGQTQPTEMGAHDAGVNTGTATINGLTAKSAVAFVGGTLWGNTLSMLDRSGGWTDDGSATGVNQSIFAFHQTTQVATDGDSASITVSAPTYFNLLCMQYEVLFKGVSPPKSSVVVTNHAMVDLGTIGLETRSCDFDCKGADLLIIAAARTNNSYFGPAAYNYGGVPIAMREQLDVRNLDTSTAMEIAFLARPPDGLQTLYVTGHTGYWGYTTVYLVGLKSLSGVVGARVSAPISGTGANFELADSVPGSLLLAFVSAIFPKKNVTPNYGWDELESNLTSPSINAWLWEAYGGPGQNLILAADGYAAMAGIIVEMQVAVTTVPDRVGHGAAAQLPDVGNGSATNLGRLTPNGQDFHVYWETWEDIPNKAVDLLEPDDFYLARIPSMVSHVCLAFAVPRFTYTGLDDDLKPTTGLNFPGSPRLLRATLDLLRARNPGIKILVSMQQNTPEEAHNEPYDPNGWGGMDAANVASTLKFIQDMALDGVVCDYECLSASIQNDHRCQIDATTGAVTCYTDAELLQTIKTLRAGIPRPLLLFVDGIHVGAYAQGDYVYAPPVGQNGGYNICMTTDPDVLAALDGIHAMTYDAGFSYDPRTAFRAYHELFPGIKIWLGLRTGPPQWENVKQDAYQMRDFCNTVIRLGGGGVHMYSGMWDIGYTGRYDGAQNQGPFGDYSQQFPDGNVAAAVVADVFHTGNDDVPPGYGYDGRHNQMRLNNEHLWLGRMGPIR